MNFRSIFRKNGLIWLIMHDEFEFWGFYYNRKK